MKFQNVDASPSDGNTICKEVADVKLIARILIHAIGHCSPRSTILIMTSYHDFEKTIMVLVNSKTRRTMSNGMNEYSSDEFYVRNFFASCISIRRTCISILKLHTASHTFKIPFRYENVIKDQSDNEPNFLRGNTLGVSANCHRVQIIVWVLPL